LVVVVPLVLVVEVEVEPVEVLVVAGGHVSDTTTDPFGSDRVESETPSGTCSVSSCAPRSRTVTVQVAADADGNALTPNTASADAAASPPTASFRLLSTFALFLPGSAGARLDRDRVATPSGRY
jgi:hypothetical protein